MARITGFKIHQYDIPAEGKYPERHFDGFKVYISNIVLPSEGQGFSTGEFKIAKEDIKYIFQGYTADTLGDAIGREFSYELDLSAKTPKIVRAVFEK